MDDLLGRLVATAGVSGRERPIREAIQEAVEPHVDEVRTDDLGNLICRAGAGEPSLMVAAHMDQIGLSVKRVDEDGFVRLSAVGGVTRQSLLNQRVTIHGDEPVTGVIGMKPPHLMDDEERDDLPEIEDLFVDVGAEDADDVAEAGVTVGDVVTFERELTSLQNGYVTGPALDNRVGCAVAIDALRRIDTADLDAELVTVFTTQEEVGLKGAKTAAFGVDPDVGLAVDTTIAGDVPSVEPDESDVATGDGVEITLIQSGGRGLIATERVRDWLLDAAEAGDHDHRRGVWDDGATDGANIYLERGGIPTGSIGVPTRHIHSATEVVDVEDMETTAAFLEDAVMVLPEHF